MKEPIQHIQTYKAIKQPISLELFWMIERIKNKLTRDQKEKLTNIADLALIKELYQA